MARRRKVLINGLPPPPPPTRKEWTFDSDAADRLFDEAMQVSIELANAEVSQLLLRRKLLHKCYEFCDAIMPLDELQDLRRTATEWATYDVVRIGMPKQLQQYLRSKKLPLPHGNSTNWFLGSNCQGRSRMSLSLMQPTLRKVCRWHPLIRPRWSVMPGIKPRAVMAWCCPLPSRSVTPPCWT
jgi:hypothetical protein